MDIKTVILEAYVNKNFKIKNNIKLLQISDDINHNIIQENNLYIIKILIISLIHMIFRIVIVRYSNNQQYSNLIVLEDFYNNNSLFLYKSQNKNLQYCIRNYLNDFKYYKYILPYYLSYNFILIINYSSSYTKKYNINYIYDIIAFNASCYMKINNYI